MLDMIYIALHMIYIAPLLLHMIYISPLSSCTSIFKIQVHSYAQVLMDMRHMMAMQDMMQCKTYDRWHYTYHACICCRTFNNNKCMRLETLCCPYGCPPSLWATNRLMDWVGLMGQDPWGNRLKTSRRMGQQLDWWVKTDGATDYSSKATKLILQGGPLKLKANPLDGGEKVVRVAWCVVRVWWYVMCFGLSSLLPLVAGGDW